MDRSDRSKKSNLIFFLLLPRDSSPGSRNTWCKRLLLMLSVDLQVLTAIKHASGSKSCFSRVL